MLTYWPQYLAFNRQAEGPYSDNPLDPGNWTSGKRGIGKLIGSHGIDAPTASTININLFGH